MPLYLSSVLCWIEKLFLLLLPSNVHRISALKPSSSIDTFGLLRFDDMVGDCMGENRILDEVGVREGNQILDDVGEREEADIVESTTGEEHDEVGKGGESKMGRNSMSTGSLIVNEQRRRIQPDPNPPSPGGNELKQCKLQSADPCQSAEPHHFQSLA